MGGGDAGDGVPLNPLGVPLDGGHDGGEDEDDEYNEYNDYDDSGMGMRGGGGVPGVSRRAGGGRAAFCLTRITWETPLLAAIHVAFHGCNPHTRTRALHEVR